jgi:hypothetical protein
MAQTVSNPKSRRVFDTDFKLQVVLRIPLIVTGDSGIVTADSGDRDRAWCCAV